MSKRVFFGQNDLRYYYYLFKDSKYYSISVFGLVISVCVILIVGVILPQIREHLSIRQQAAERREAIRIINENINFLNSLDKNELNSQLETLSRALPPDKNFTGIINSLSDASVQAGVTLADFSFNVGEIASESAVPNSLSQDSIQADNLPEEMQVVESPDSDQETNISTTVIINGSIDKAGLFLKELEKRLPLSEVTQITTENNTATISLKFYYEPFPEVVFKDSDALVPVTGEERKLVETLKSWQSPIIFDDPFVSEQSPNVPLFE